MVIANGTPIYTHVILEYTNERQHLLLDMYISNFVILRDAYSLHSHTHSHIHTLYGKFAAKWQWLVQNMRKLEWNSYKMHTYIQTYKHHKNNIPTKQQ